MPDGQIQTTRLTDDLYNRLLAYADDNNLSVSAALADALGMYARGEVSPPDRKRRTRRVAFWIDAEDWRQFAVKVSQDGTTQVDAIEKALRESL